MDFLQASIDAALKSDASYNQDETPEFTFDESAYEFNFDESYFPESSGENNDDTQASGDDEQPPVLEESVTHDGVVAVSHLDESAIGSGPPAISRAYQEDIIPLDKCTLNGNRLSIEGCKYTFVRLNVRNNIYFRCVNCYGIYQKRRTMVSKSGYTIDVPSVGSLKLVPTGNGEIRGNPNQPSGILHCCESEKFKEAIRDMPPPKRIENRPIDPLTLFVKNGNNNGNGSLDAFSLFNKISTPRTPVGTGPDDDVIIPAEKCRFMGKRLEIEGCKFVFSRTQSGPRDYYRCCACIALYHKRHFRKLPTPKIGSLSLIRETGVLTGNAELPRGLPHICVNLDLHCDPIKADYRTKTQISNGPLSALLDDVRKSINLNSSNGLKNGNGFPKPLSHKAKLDNDTISSLFQNELNKLNKRALNDDIGPQNKLRKIVEDFMGPASKLPVKSSMNGNSPPSLTVGAYKKEDDVESTYPHTNDLQLPPKKMLPDHDLSHSKRNAALNQCYAQFPKFPNQGRVIVFADSLLTEFQSKNLNPSTSLVRAEFPVTPSHLLTLCSKAKFNHDCFSKTKQVFFILGYDMMRCMDLSSLERKINVVQNEFLEMRQFLDQESVGRDIVLTFITVPEMGPLTKDLEALNDCMKRMIDGINREDVQIYDWAEDYTLNPTKFANVEDRISSLMRKMSGMCGVELLDED